MNVNEKLPSEKDGGDKIYEAKEFLQTSDIKLAVVEFSSKRKRASIVVKHTV
jgi:magnesium-transporting ATPase (P-type)